MTSSRYRHHHKQQTIGSKKIFRYVINGEPYGLWYWQRDYRQGLVLRVGPLGHCQLLFYRFRLVGKYKDNRRGEHGIQLSFWGVRGRRRKRTIKIAVHL